MSPSLAWWEIGLRLLLSLLAGALVGVNRGEHGRPAGLRTTMLVCLASCVAMIQVNLLLSLAGRPHDSFVMNDLMRLPLGILSGMGFIGAGAIMRKGDLVQGVTTAATLWLMTVLGLCYGGGLYMLGVSALILGWLVLWGLKKVEKRWVQDRRAELRVVVTVGSNAMEMLHAMLAAEHITLRMSSASYFADGQKAKFSYQLRWMAPKKQELPHHLLSELAKKPGIEELQCWIRF